jgi:hypothetical protein
MGQRSDPLRSITPLLSSQRSVGSPAAAVATDKNTHEPPKVRVIARDEAISRRCGWSWMSTERWIRFELLAFVAPLSPLLRQEIPRCAGMTWERSGAVDLSDEYQDARNLP